MEFSGANSGENAPTMPAPMVTSENTASAPRMNVRIRCRKPSHMELSVASNHSWWGTRTQSVRGVRRRCGSRRSRPNDDAERRRSSHTAAQITYTVPARTSRPRPTAGIMATPVKIRVPITMIQKKFSSASMTRSVAPKNMVLGEKVLHSLTESWETVEEPREGAGDCGGCGGCGVPCGGKGRVCCVSAGIASVGSHGGVGRGSGVVMSITLRFCPCFPRQS